MLAVGVDGLAHPSGVAESACWPRLQWADGWREPEGVHFQNSSLRWLLESSCWCEGSAAKHGDFLSRAPRDRRKWSKGVQGGRQGVFCDIAQKSHPIIPQPPVVVTKVSPMWWRQGLDYHKVRTFEGHMKAGCWLSTEFGIIFLLIYSYFISPYFF